MSIKSLNQILLDNEEPENYVSLTFAPVKVLGSGAFSTVIECFNQLKYGKVAIKVINKNIHKRNIVAMLTKEAEFLRQLRHKSILKFIEHRESSNRVYLITELVEGISLNKLIEQRQNVSNKKYQKELSTSINYKQSIEISNQVKTKLIYFWQKENILIEQLDDNQCKLKIIDFGLSFMKTPEIGVSQDNCGTPIFQAPEIFEGDQYNEKVDIWSLGIIQYMLFHNGKHPIWKEEEDNIEQYENDLLNYSISNIHFTDSMDEVARNFFLKTAAFLPENRMTAEQCLRHPWITGDINAEPPRTTIDVIQEIEKLKKFEQKLRFIQILLYIGKNGEKFHLKQNDDEECSLQSKLEFSKQLNIGTPEECNSPSSFGSSVKQFKIRIYKNKFEPPKVPKLLEDIDGKTSRYVLTKYSSMKNLHATLHPLSSRTLKQKSHNKQEDRKNYTQLNEKSYNEDKIQFARNNESDKEEFHLPQLNGHKSKFSIYAKTLENSNPNRNRIVSDRIIGNQLKY